MYSKNHFDYLISTYDPFKMLNYSEQFSMYKLIMDSNSKSVYKVHFNNSNAVALKSFELRSIFHSSNNRYKEIVPYFFDCINEKYEFNSVLYPFGGYTKEFKLKDELKRVLSSFNSTARTKLLAKDGKQIKAVPTNTVSSKDKDGLIAKSTVRIQNNIVVINSDALDKLIEFVQYALSVNDAEVYNDTLNPKHVKSIYDLENILLYLINLKSITNHNLTYAPSLITTYTEGKSGRLFANQEINPQQMPSEIRKVIFSNLGYFDYDLENCNFQILYQMYHNFKKIVAKKNEIKKKNTFTVEWHYLPISSTKFKIPTDELYTIQRYLNHKFLFRNDLALELDLEMNTVKTILLALVMGAKLPTHPRKNSAIWKLINYNTDIYLKILNNETLKRLVAEIKIATDFILKHSEHFNNAGTLYLKNLADKNLPLKRKKKSEKISHILQGVESSILETVCNNINTVAVLIFDGFITTEKIQNLDYLIMSIKEVFTKMNFPLQVQFSENELKFDLERLELNKIKVA